MLRRIYKLDHLYGLLLTLGVTLILEGCRGLSMALGHVVCRARSLTGVLDLGFMMLPAYRAWVVVGVACCVRRGVVGDRAYASSAHCCARRPRTRGSWRHSASMCRRMVTLTYGFGVAIAALAGVLAAPVMQVSPLMGQSVIITVFAIVVIGGMGSIAGSVLTSLALGVIESLTKMFYPEASATVVFVVMALVLLVRPAGLFGQSK